MVRDEYLDREAFLDGRAARILPREPRGRIHAALAIILVFRHGGGNTSRGNK
jgi:hypothetical protein